MKVKLSPATVWLGSVTQIANLKIVIYFKSTLEGELVMSKEQKSKKETKKAKDISEETKRSKQEKKDPKRHDGPAK